MHAGRAGSFAPGCARPPMLPATGHLLPAIVHCSQNGYVSSRGGCQHRRHSLVNWDHGDLTTRRFDSPAGAAGSAAHRGRHHPRPPPHPQSRRRKGVQAAAARGNPQALLLRPPIDAPCTHCLRHGDLIDAKKALTAAASPAGHSSRGRLARPGEGCHDAGCYWRAVHAMSQARRPNTREETTHLAGGGLR
jgi:hypothetical protein